jgi:hypothetical protein
MNIILSHHLLGCTLLKTATVTLFRLFPHFGLALGGGAIEKALVANSLDC